MPGFMKGKNGKIFEGDHLKVLSKFPNDSIDLTVTSPPYDNLRTYNHYQFDYKKLGKELYRVTKKGGVVVWVVGDATISGSETGTSFRQALFFKRVGFHLNDTMIFRKRNSAPTSTAKHKRYEQEFDFIFVFSKGSPKTFNVITVPRKSISKQHLQKNHIGIQQYGFKRKLRKKIKRRKDVIITGKRHKSGIVKRRIYSQPTEQKKRKRKGNIWTYSRGSTETKDKFAFEHPAIFPEKLAEDHILSWSNPGQIVLDPMCGSGTVLKMAKKHGRKFIGIDISKEYIQLSKMRVGTINEKT